MTLEQLRQANADAQRLYKPEGELAHLGRALDFAMDRILRASLGG